MTMDAILARFRDPQHGPLPPLLLILTVVTGLVDAVSYLKLGHIFVANMTGNVVFLGFAVADAQEFSVPASLAAIVAFLAGAVFGGRLVAKIAHRGRLLATATVIEIGLVAVALAAAIAGEGTSDVVRYALIVLLAIAMGLQNASARKLGVPDLTTTVLTLTLTGFAAESTFAGGHNPRLSRRVLATAAMLVGAAIGAFMVLHLSVASVLGLSLVLLVLAGIPAVREASSSEAWATA